MGRGDGVGWGGRVVVEDRTGKMGRGQEQVVRELASGRGKGRGAVWRGRAEGVMVDGVSLGRKGRYQR